MISLTVPVYNEREALLPLFEKVQRTMRSHYGHDWEIIFVNDGSHDGSEKLLDELAAKFPGQDVPVVCHGGTIRACVAHALKLDAEAALSLTIDTLSVTRVDRLEGAGVGHSWRVGFVNRPPA